MMQNPVNKRKRKALGILVKKIGAIEQRLLNLSLPLNNDRWIDGEEACKILHVSSRTLSTYRTEGVIGFSQFRDKIYYNYSEIEAHFAKHYKKPFAKK